MTGTGEVSITWTSSTIYMVPAPRPDLSDYLQQLREAKREEDKRFEQLVDAWKASSKRISFDKWRSREVCEIRNAWLAAGTESASLAEQESWYQQEQIRSCQT